MVCHAALRLRSAGVFRPWMGELIASILCQCALNNYRRLLPAGVIRKMSIIQLIKAVMNEKMTLKKRLVRTFINPFITLKAPRSRVRSPSRIKEIPS